MENIPRQKLCELITTYGRNLCEEPKRLRGMLRDVCPQYLREVNVLLIALEQRVPRALLHGLAYELTAHRLIKQLYDDVGIAEEVARWAVDTWALALGVIQVVPEPPKTVLSQSVKQTPVQIVENLGNGVILEMVYIPGGTFLMGSPVGEGHNDEKPQHSVTIQPFYMGKYPVTQAQYQAIMGNNPAHFKGDNRPVETISWKGAVEFCEKLSKRTGKTYQLPSEAEWEYACRAGTTTRFSFGDNDNDLQHYGWFNSNSGGKTHPVGEKKPNPWGLYDMHGNVWEWTHSDYTSSYDGSEVRYSKDYSKNKTLRGGSWNYNSSNCRVAARYNLTPSFKVGTSPTAFVFCCSCPRTLYPLPFFSFTLFPLTLIFFLSELGFLG